MPERDTPRVLALCGSLREESRTRIALDVALTAAGDSGVVTDLVDLRGLTLPSLHATDGTPPDADRLCERVDRADAVLLGTPNYHGSYSGSLKNALDYCGREEFADTTVGLLEVAAGAVPGSALIHLRTVCRTLHAWTLPTEVAVPDSHAVITDGGIADDDIAQRVRGLGRELADYAGVARYPELADQPRPSGDIGDVHD
ncbi:NAD(P)H-dependent oxidoreductase [Haloarcula sp. S1CR25-12]|uniref:NAD(P)H-dependent oxidoreductase n=1 Tax=Haloarcula saliterrae TaxID=2950534 RepID=A0ABU2F812_9EURY|nr:NAD(P)H-dependent oxidoreductase [Haloarcula sp. S1CR25-12]MDS0258322.1 NAD(P)H-dependent oxidoreductase [Haloarcula sp. S1CR25-12]